MLKDKYFCIKEKAQTEGSYTYKLQLMSDHEVYQGHFPGNPVSPGVCSIQTIRECCEDAIGQQLSIDTISQCRFLALLTPDKGNDLKLTLNLTADDEAYKVEATLEGNDTTYVKLKGLLAKL